MAAGFGQRDWEHYADRLGDLAHGCLRREPTGLGEFALMKSLAAAGASGLAPAPGGDSLTLFRRHFVLFHALYRLRDRLRGAGEADLDIHCLRIVLLPPSPARSTLPAARDALRDYYLDLANLTDTTAADVEALLAGFWQLHRADGERAAALAVLELTEPAGPEEIKRQYRRLAARHHPDRGGDTARLQEINAAMAVLARSSA